MKVGLDTRTLHVKGGSRTYAYNLVRALSKLDGIDITLFGGDAIGNFIPINPPPKNDFLRPMWENISILPYIKRKGIDIFHGLKHVIPLFTKVKTVVTVHDLSALKFPFLFHVKSRLYWELLTKRYIKSADKIIAISNSTKEDLIDFFGVSEEKIMVIHLGVNESFLKMGDDTRKIKDILKRSGVFLSDADKVISSVGTIQPRKNYVRLIKAFEILGKNQDLKLLIAGRRGWKTDEIFDYMKRSEVGDKIHYLGYVLDDALPALYKASDLFVYPSLYEGFGLPPLEAMACGTPVITSNTSSLPEVVGDAGIMVDPYDVKGLGEAMCEVLESDTLQRRMRRKGLERAKKFSWEKTARETVETYKKVLDEK